MLPGGYTYAVQLKKKQLLVRLYLAVRIKRFER